MEFTDILFTMVIPVLAAVSAGLAVNFFAQTRKKSLIRKITKLQEELEQEREKIEAEKEEVQRISVLRAELLNKWQKRFIAPLEKIRTSLRIEECLPKEFSYLQLNKSESGVLEEFEAEHKNLRRAQVGLHPQVRHSYGLILAVTGRLEEAVHQFREELLIDSTNLNARANLGTMLFRLRRYQDARQEFSTLAELASHRFDAHFGLGLCLIAEGRIEKGIEALSSAISLRPDYPPSYCELGHAYALKGDLERAMESVQVALRLDSKIHEGRVLYQQLLIKQGQFDEAINDCRRFSASFMSGIVYYNMALAHNMKGEREDSIKALREAFQLDDSLRYRAKDDPNLASLGISKRFQDLLEGKPGLF